ncbi:MAG: 4Fe-4S binding protein [Anaerolineaceae bacterium]|nr:4Fe-4S binding protein [Anaerolineaceae bacterium]
MFACARRFGEGGLSSSCIGVRSAGGVRKGFIVVVCRACQDPPCARVCPTDALKLREGGGVHLKADLCIGCGNCAEACPFGAVLWNQDENKPQICLYCGYCEPFCPYEVIVMEEIEQVNYAGQ